MYEYASLKYSMLKTYFDVESYIEFVNIIFCFCKKKQLLQTAGYLIFAAYLSSAAGDAAEFKMYKRTAASTCSNLTLSLPSVIQCAGHCKLNKECSGFTYNETNGDCVMSCCVNPQQLEEAAGGDDDVIYAEATPNHLLARGVV